MRLEMEWGREWRQWYILLYMVPDFGHLQKVKMMVSGCYINDPEMVAVY